MTDLTAGKPPPLVVHLVHRFDVGGMENGLVNIINRMDPTAFQHAVVALSGDAPMKARLQNPSVPVVCIGKRPGKDIGTYFKVAKVLKRLDAAVLHTRNVGTLDYQVSGLLAGVRTRVHGEHGRDVDDPDGTNVRLIRRRQVLCRAVKKVSAVSRDLAEWLVRDVHLPAAKVVRICNGVDTERFRPSSRLWAGGPLALVSVSRLEAIKHPQYTVRAFHELKRLRPKIDATLTLIGDGALRPELERLVADLGLDGLVFFEGESNDVADRLRSFDVFLLGSLKEGISNTVLEAMASGLPVIATDVGGNGELVTDAIGALVPSDDSDAMARAIAELSDSPLRANAMAVAARTRCVELFSLDAMVSGYQNMYLDALA